MVSYTWVVESMEVYTKVNDKENVVFNVHWICYGDYQTYVASAYGSCLLPAPSQNFFPYEELTEAQVIAWIFQNGVHRADTESLVYDRIQAKANPVTKTPPLPW